MKNQNNKSEVQVAENFIRYKGKGEHSVNELEKIIEQREEEIHLLKVKPTVGEHAKGEWIQNGENGIHTKEGHCIALTYGENGLDRKSNAQRIVKCVNGWDGLIATIKDMLKEAEDACKFHGNNPDKSSDIIKWRNFLKQAEQK